MQTVIVIQSVSISILIWQSVTASDSHAPAVETALHCSYHKTISVDDLCGCCRWRINFPGVTRTLPVCMQMPNEYLLQSWCTSLTQHGNMLSWTCSKKVSPCRQLHDAALGNVTFPHLPPIGLSCIRGLVAPGYKGHASCLQAAWL